MEEWHVDTAVATLSPQDSARQVLTVCLAALSHVDHPDAEIAAGVQEIGALWARSGGAVDDLLTVLNAMAREVDDTGTLRYEACGRLAVDLMRGFRQDAPEPEELARPAVTVAFRAKGPADVVATAYRGVRRSGMTCVVQGDRGHLHLPSSSQEEAMRECRDVVAGLPEHQIRMAVVHGAGSDDLACATQLLGIVGALGLPPGVYHRADVLVEHAVARSPVSSRVLRRLIAPVMESHSLRTTLAALIAEGGNRSGAEDRLIIHRSTIDYRLTRIEQLTGQSPLTVKGLRVLTAAYALCA
jgi:hypothetical protein